MVNYTLGEGFKKLTEFEVKYNTGDVCIVGSLDYEVRNSYEFPVIATDRGMHNLWKIFLGNYQFTNYNYFYSKSINKFIPQTG